MAHCSPLREKAVLFAGCADFYACQFPAMITDWKEKWNGGTGTNAGRPKPFLFVELAPYTEGAGEPYDTSSFFAPFYTKTQYLPRQAQDKHRKLKKRERFCRYDTSVSAVRMAQMAALNLPLVGMAAAYDYGDSKSPLGT
jgi:hypothetical protein